MTDVPATPLLNRTLPRISTTPLAPTHDPTGVPITHGPESTVGPTGDDTATSTRLPPSTTVLIPDVTSEPGVSTVLPEDDTVVPSTGTSGPDVGVGREITTYRPVVGSDEYDTAGPGGDETVLTPTVSPGPDITTDVGDDITTLDDSTTSTPSVSSRPDATTGGSVTSGTTTLRGSSPVDIVCPTGTIPKVISRTPKGEYSGLISAYSFRWSMLLILKAIEYFLSMILYRLWL